MGDRYRKGRFYPGMPPTPTSFRPGEKLMTPAKFAVRVKPDGGCEVWTGGKCHKTGYGKVTFNYRTWLPHRLAWTFTHGPIPEGMRVLHTCDNRLCVKLSHLFLGTAKDNTQDMLAKGRNRFGPNAPHKHGHPPERR